MEIINETNDKMDETTTTTPTTITKEEILKGDVNIPVKDVFGFVIQHITETYGQRMGVGSVIDRNFLYFQQLGFRKKIEKIDKYTFLHPLVTNDEAKNSCPTLVAIEPHNQCKNELGELIDKKAYIIYILHPKCDDITETDALNKLNSFFQNEIRNRAGESKGLQFGHILESILQCEERGYIHFTIESDDESSSDYAFEYYNKNLFVYNITHQPPYESHEMSALSPWISSTQAYFQRNITATRHFKFTNDELELIKNDPEVKMLRNTIEESQREIQGKEHK